MHYLGPGSLLCLRRGNSAARPSWRRSLVPVAAVAAFSTHDRVPPAVRRLVSELACLGAESLQSSAGGGAHLLRAQLPLQGTSEMSHGCKRLL